MIDIFKMSWDEVAGMAERLATMLQGKKIYGIPRGGAVVAAVMAYHSCKLVQFATEAEVVVDDIVDTGATLSKRTHDTAIEKLKLSTAALVIRYGCAPVPDYWVMMVNVKDYILFPWETEQEYVNFMNTHYQGEQ